MKCISINYSVSHIHEIFEIVVLYTVYLIGI